MTIRGFQNFEDDSDLQLPRILCLHGGGSNADIFRTQCRMLVASLKFHFRLVFVDAPFLSQAGPCILSMYEDYGPFRRWLRWTPDHPEISAASGVAEIENSLRVAMNEDDQAGASGEWVGVLGFSQGARIGASLLFHQQASAEKSGLWQRGGTKTTFRFAILMAGQGPLVSLDPETITSATLHDASMISSGATAGHFSETRHEHILNIPTLHVHGLQDPGLELHRGLLEDYCEKGTARLVEWDGDHRLPIRNKDVSAVVEEILAISRATGVLRR